MKLINPNIFLLKLLLLTTVYFFYIGVPNAQPPLPDRDITITATQAFQFGTFSLVGGVGGTVTVGYDGSRSATGGIYLSALAPTAQPAIFDIRLCQGRNVTITFSPTTILTGSNGGTFTLDIGPTEKGVSGSQFPVDNDCNFITNMRVGGTLHVPGNAPPGTYSGNFEITFEQQ